MPRSVPGRPAKRRTFGATWWGQAWIDALEHRARLDSNRLPRGRTYARQSRVGVLTVEPGEVRASVLGPPDSPYRVRLRFRPFSAEQWAVVTHAIAARARHAPPVLAARLAPRTVHARRSSATRRVGQ